MDCKNINLEEVIKKAKEYDILKERCESLIKDNEIYCNQFKKISEYLNKLTDHYVGYYAREELFDNFKRAFEALADKEGQGYALAQQRERNNQEFKEQLEAMNQEMEYREEQLTLAWEKFRAIKTKQYQKTLREINAL